MLVILLLLALQLTSAATNVCVLAVNNGSFYASNGAGDTSAISTGASGTNVAGTKYYARCNAGFYTSTGKTGAEFNAEYTCKPGVSAGTLEDPAAGALVCAQAQCLAATKNKLLTGDANSSANASLFQVTSSSVDTITANRYTTADTANDAKLWIQCVATHFGSPNKRLLTCKNGKFYPNAASGKITCNPKCVAGDLTTPLSNSKAEKKSGAADPTGAELNPSATYQVKCQANYYTAAGAPAGTFNATCDATAGTWTVATCSPIFDTTAGNPEWRKIADYKCSNTDVGDKTGTAINVGGSVTACSGTCKADADCKFFSLKGAACVYYKKCTLASETGSAVYHKEQCVLPSTAATSSDKYYQLKYRVKANTVKFDDGNFISVEGAIPTESEKSANIVKKSGAAVVSTDQKQVFRVTKDVSDNYSFHTAMNGAVLTMNDQRLGKHKFFAYNKEYFEKHSYPDYKNFAIDADGYTLYTNYAANLSASNKEVTETKMFSNATGFAKKQIAICLVKADDQAPANFKECSDPAASGAADKYGVYQTAAAASEYARASAKKWPISSKFILKCRQPAGGKKHFGKNQTSTCTKASSGDPTWVKSADITCTETDKKVCDAGTIGPAKLIGGAFLEEPACDGTLEEGSFCTPKCPTDFTLALLPTDFVKWKCGSTWTTAKADGSASSGAGRATCTRAKCDATELTDGNVVLSGSGCTVTTDNKVAVQSTQTCKLNCAADAYADITTNGTAEGEAKCTVDGWDVKTNKICYKKCDHDSAPPGVKYMKWDGTNLHAFGVSEVVEYTTRIKAQCKDGYTLDGAEVEYKCQKDGNIVVKTSGAAAITCESNTCSIADLNSKLDDLKLNAKVKGTSNTPIEHDQTTTIECKDGFTGEDKPSPKCHRGTGWPDAEITCTAATDGSATATVNAIAAVVAGAAFIF